MPLPPTDIRRKILYPSSNSFTISAQLQQSVFGSICLAMHVAVAGQDDRNTGSKSHERLPANILISS